MDKNDESSASSQRQFNPLYNQSYQPLRKNSNTNNNLNLYNNASHLLHSSSHFDNVTSMSSKTSFGTNSVSTPQNNTIPPLFIDSTTDRSIVNSSFVNSPILNSSIIHNSAINSSIITSSIMNTSISNQAVTSDYTADDELDDSGSDNTMIPKVQSTHNSFQNSGNDSDCFESMTELTTVLTSNPRFSDPRPSIQYFENDSGEYNLKNTLSNSSSKRNLPNSKSNSEISINSSTVNSSTLKVEFQDPESSTYNNSTMNSRATRFTDVDASKEDVNSQRDLNSPAFNSRQGLDAQPNFNRQPRNPRPPDSTNEVGYNFQKRPDKSCANSCSIKQLINNQFNLIYSGCVTIVLMSVMIAILRCVVVMQDGSEESYTMKQFNENLAVEEERCYNNDIPYWIDLFNSSDCNLEQPMCKGQFKGTKCWVPDCQIGTKRQQCTAFKDEPNGNHDVQSNPISRRCTEDGWADEVIWEDDEGIYYAYPDEEKYFFGQDSNCMHWAVGRDDQFNSYIDEVQADSDTVHQSYKQENIDYNPYYFEEEQIRNETDDLYEDAEVNVEYFDHDSVQDRSAQPTTEYTNSGTEFPQTEHPPIMINTSKDETLSDSFEQDPEGILCMKEEGPFMCFMHNHLQYLYMISGLSCFIALLLYASMPKLLSPRSIVHMNLFVVFLMKAILFTMKTRHVIKHSKRVVQLFEEEYRSNETIERFNDRPDEKHRIIVGIHENVENKLKTEVAVCQILSIANDYFEVARYSWILMEALYLHALVFVVFLDERGLLSKFLLFGWLVPLIPTIPYVCLRYVLQSNKCWDLDGIADNAELLAIHNYPAFCMVMMVCVLFIHILVELWRKITYQADIENQERTRVTGKKSVSAGGGGLSLGSLFKDKRRNSTVNKKSISRLIKSFAILFPLFVGHKMITVWLLGFRYHVDLKWYEGSNLAVNMRLVIEIVCTHLQGFVVSILYCFGCKDVQQEIRFQYNTSRFARVSDKRRYSRRYSKRGSTATQATVISRSASDAELERFQLNPINKNNARKSSIRLANETPD